MKNLKWITLTLPLALSTTAFADSTKLRLAHMNSENHIIHTEALKLKNIIESKSNGQVMLDIFPSGQLGSNAQVAELISMGSPIVGHMGTPNLADYNPDFNVTTYPFLFRDFDEALTFTNGSIVKEMEKKLEKNNLKVMCYFAFGVRDVYTKNTPVRTPKDMKNMKIREQPLTLYIELAKQSFTAIPTPMPWTEVYNALSYGIIDAAEAPPSALLDQKHYEHVKYYSQTNHIHDISTFTMGVDTFNKLSPSDQVILTDAFDATCQAITKSVKSNYESEVNKLRDLGMIIISDVDRAAFEENSRDIYKSFPEWSDGLYQRAVKSVAEYRAESIK